MSIRFYGPCKGTCGDLAGSYDYRESLRSFWGQTDNLKPCVVLTITVRCSYGDRHCDVSSDYGLTVFSNLSLCGVKHNRRGHDARKSVRRSQGLPTVARKSCDSRTMVLREMINQEK